MQVNLLNILGLIFDLFGFALLSFGTWKVLKRSRLIGIKSELGQMIKEEQESIDKFEIFIKSLYEY